MVYDGRTQSTLGPGDRIVLCKPDGTLLIHQPTGREPVNWQSPGGTHETALAGDEILVRSRRDSPVEVVKIRFEDVFQISSYLLTDEQELTLVGMPSKQQTLNSVLLNQSNRLILHDI